jgi:hypothetical protein
MKPITQLTLLVGVFFSLLFPRVGSSQGSINYVSNVGLPSSGSASVSANAWYAADFISGENNAGYSLDSIQLQLTDASGTPNSFTVMIYMGIDEHGGVFPGASVGTLAGSVNPTTRGVYTYSPTSSLSLLPNTEYFVVLTADTPVASGAYGWSVTSSPSPGYNSYHWGGEVDFQSSSDGLNWSFTSANYGQFALNATSTPEPGVVGLLAVGGLIVAMRRRIAKCGVRLSD